MLLVKGNRRELVGRGGNRLPNGTGTGTGKGSVSLCSGVGGRRALLQDSCTTRLTMAKTDKWSVGPGLVGRLYLNTT